jgi:GT2 family glycosyltransferase
LKKERTWDITCNARGIGTKQLIARMRWILKGVLWFFLSIIRRNRRLYSLARSILFLKRNGIRAATKKIGVGIQKRVKKRFSRLEKELVLTKNKRTIQEKTVFPRKIKFSVITPLYNTQEECLVTMIESVIAQTYHNWELCLTDGSDAGYDNIRFICERYAQDDNRIKYKKLERNEGISQNSNKAIEMTTGEYIGLLEHDDALHPSAFYEVMRVICQEKEADFIYTDEAIFSPAGNIVERHHKPDFAVDTLCSHNYISRFTVFSRTLMEKAGLFRAEFDGSQDYDLILRYTAIAHGIYHIPKLLYFHQRREKSNVNKKINVISAAEKALNAHLKQRGISAQVEAKIGLPGYYRIIYKLTERPLVSIIIPNKDNVHLLRNCLSSIIEKTTYDNYEIIIAENNSADNATENFYKELKRYPNIHVVYWEGKEFNFSEICNTGFRRSNGKHLIFLNNDIEIITPNWIEEMLMYCQRDDVGAVGAKLYFSNRSIQHAGVVLGVEEGTTGHVYYGTPLGYPGYMGKLMIVQNMSAVTAACMMVRRKVFEEAGFFEPEFKASYNDIDLCLKIKKAGYLIVWTPYAEAYHLESRSRGYNTTRDKKHQLIQEKALFKAKWKEDIARGDPYYNRNFSLENANYKLK